MLINSRPAARIIKTLLLAAVYGLGSAGVYAADKAPVTMKVVYGDPANQPANAPLYAIEEKLGYFKAEGIVGAYQPVDSATTAMALLGSGTAQISITGFPAAAAAYARDPNLRIVAVQGGSIWKIAVPADSKVKKLTDLAGAKIGVSSVATASKLFAQSSLTASGVDPSKYSFIPVGVAAQAGAALKSGTIDAYASYLGGIEAPFVLTGTPFRLLASPLDDLAGLTVIVTTKQVLEQNRDAVRGWLRAWIKASVFAAENPKAATLIHWEVAPASRPAGDLNKAADALLPTVEGYLKNAVKLVPGQTKIGMTETAAMQKTVDFLADNGILAKKFDVSGMVDLSLVPAANDFDAQEVKKAAAAMKQ